jgi:hypothetical protein
MPLICSTAGNYSVLYLRNSCDFYQIRSLYNLTLPPHPLLQSVNRINKCRLSVCTAPSIDLLNHFLSRRYSFWSPTLIFSQIGSPFQVFFLGFRGLGVLNVESFPDFSTCIAVTVFRDSWKRENYEGRTVGV